MARTNRVTLGVVVACAAQFLVGVDGLAVAIALPSVQADLGAAVTDAQWVLTGYGVTFGGSLLLCGRLGDLYGRRRLLVSGMALFALGCLLAGLSPGLGLLVAARVVEGLGAAAAVPSALGSIGGLLPPGVARTRALTLMAAMASVGIMTGLLTGGIVTGLLGWRWVFLSMVPVAALVAVVAPRVLPEGRAAAGHGVRPDVAGAVLVTGALVAVLLGSTRVAREGVTAAASAVPLAGGAVLLCAFVAWERRVPDPLVRFAILRLRSLRIATLGVGANSITFTAIAYVGSLYLQGVLRYGAMRAGLALLPVDAVALVVALAVGRAVAHRSPRVLLLGSFAFTAAALVWLGRAPARASYLADVMPPLVVLGASMSVAFVVLTQEAVAEVAPADKGVASGIFETANHLWGGGVGVALYATVMAATSPDPHDPSRCRAAFLTAASLAVLGVAVSTRARRRPQPAQAATATEAGPA